MRRFISYSELKERFGINYCRVHLRRLMRANRFPLCATIGLGRIGWYEDEVVEWVNNRPRSEFKPEDDYS